jgi:autoinducer 2 (AI-2) kinase
VLNLPVKVPVVKEATALGAAIMAGYGAGVYSDISKTARGLVKWDKSFIPNADNHATYEAMYTPWRKIYEAQLSLADQGVTNHMWAAPGL